AVPALMGMVVMELTRVAALARVQARGGNLGAEFKAQRVWDSKQAVYRRALGRHPATRWERFVVRAGGVDRIAKGRARPGEEPADAWLALERLLVAVAEPKASGLVAWGPGGCWWLVVGGWRRWAWPSSPRKRTTVRRKFPASTARA